MANYTIDMTQTETFLTALDNEYGRTIGRGAAKTLAKKLKLPRPGWYLDDDTFRVRRGEYRKPTLSEVQQLGVGFPVPGKRGRKPKDSTAPVTVKQAKARVVTPPASVAPRPAMSMLVRGDEANTSIQQEASKALGVDVLLGNAESVPYVPSVDPKYVPYGWFEDLKTLISSGHFLPVMVTGPSGNGKTVLFEQVCAALGREYVRVNITSQTDEDDLLGGFRLVNGETKFSLGPIPLAMLRGAFVNLDEVDLGGSALMCLQPVLEGKPLYLKKIGKYIYPAAGFSIGASANTKGRGDDGKYAHTTIMNEAMLERFAIMYEQAWPEPNVERQILSRVLKSFGKFDSTLVKHLVEFANLTRSNFEQQVCNDQIATRRLLHIARAFCALGDITKAMNGALARFDADTATAFRNLWNAIHEIPNATTNPSGVAVEPQSI